MGSLVRPVGMGRDPGGAAMKYWWSLQSWIGLAPGAEHIYVIVEDETTQQHERITFWKHERALAIRTIVDLVRRYRREGKSLHSRRCRYI